MRILYCAIDQTVPGSVGGSVHVTAVAEGLAAWLLGLLPIIALTRWIGRPHEGRDRRAVEGVDGTDLDAPASARVHGGER